MRVRFKRPVICHHSCQSRGIWVWGQSLRGARTLAKPHGKAPPSRQPRTPGPGRSTAPAMPPRKKQRKTHPPTLFCAPTLSKCILGGEGEVGAATRVRARVRGAFSLSLLLAVLHLLCFAARAW